MRNLFVSTFLFVLANPVFGQKDVPIKTIDNIKRSIVPIVCGYIDEQKNFKIVEIAGTGFSVSFESQNQPEGMPVAFTGFPLQSIVPITSKGFVGGFVGGLPNAHWFDYIIDKAAWPGASGSPVYLANGNVVGMLLVAGQNAGSGISEARSATVILDFLSKNPYTEKKPQN